MTKTWMESLVLGDTGAWNQFIDQFGSLIRYRVADVAATLGRRNDWSTIDDVTAEVFATLIANDSAALRAFGFRSRLSTYLAVIATRVARRVIRRIVGVEVQAADDSNLAIEDESAATAQHHALSKEQQERLLEFVDQLPPAWRRLVVSHYREGMTFQEISRQYDIPLGTIGTTLRRAQQRLKGWMEGDDSP